MDAIRPSMVERIFFAAYANLEVSLCSQKKIQKGNQNVPVIDSMLNTQCVRVWSERCLGSRVWLLFETHMLGIESFQTALLI